MMGCHQVSVAIGVFKGEQLDSNFNSTGEVSLDVQMIKLAQQGDADAFSVLFQTHKARVYALCLRMTNNAAEAEDLTQDAFLLMFRNLDKFRGNSALSTWLHRIAVNTVLMHFRKKSLRLISLDEPYSNEEGRQVRREYGTRDVQLAGCVDRIALTRAIKELPQGCRTVFLLHEAAGYEHQEIAELLGCSIGNSKSQLHKARRRIRELLADGRVARSLTVEAIDSRVGVRSSFQVSGTMVDGAREMTTGCQWRHLDTHKARWLEVSVGGAMRIRLKPPRISPAVQLRKTNRCFVHPTW
jgi:RNA polymerase sigma-70 factor, ECF subfamily